MSISESNLQNDPSNDPYLQALRDQYLAGNFTQDTVRENQTPIPKMTDLNEIFNAHPDIIKVYGVEAGYMEFALAEEPWGRQVFVHTSGGATATVRVYKIGIQFNPYQEICYCTQLIMEEGEAVVTDHQSEGMSRLDVDSGKMLQKTRAAVEIVSLYSLLSPDEKVPFAGKIIDNGITSDNMELETLLRSTGSNLRIDAGL